MGCDTIRAVGQKVKQPSGCFGAKLLSPGEKIPPNFLWEKLALQLFFEPRYFVLTGFSRNLVSVTTLCCIIGFVSPLSPVVSSRIRLYLHEHDALTPLAVIPRAAARRWRCGRSPWSYPPKTEWHNRRFKLQTPSGSATLQICGFCAQLGKDEMFNCFWIHVFQNILFHSTCWYFDFLSQSGWKFQLLFSPCCSL